MNRMTNGWWTLMLMGLLAGSCHKQATLETVIGQEMARGESYDSLFLGLDLTLSKKAFYDSCWQLNRLGHVRQGPANASVEYIFHDKDQHAIVLNFYPKFTGNRISE
ncbi:MAG: hypothetical protein OEY56_01350, partial [Cyclobacteriaceae bacterium]|nr:hypothetical protein [Cyclobacteriaceae bacterium]